MNIVYEKQKLNPKMTHQKLVTKGYSEQKTKKVKCSTHTHTKNWLAKAMVIIKLYTGFSVMFFNIKFSHKYLLNLFIIIFIQSNDNINRYTNKN